jgi:hypothetical protein
MTDRARAAHAAPQLPDGLLTHSEAARFLSVSPSWLYQSEIPVVRIGRRGRRYDPRELRAYIDAHRSHSLLRDR